MPGLTSGGMVDPAGKVTSGGVTLLWMAAVVVAVQEAVKLTGAILNSTCTPQSVSALPLGQSTGYRAAAPQTGAQAALPKHTLRW